ncbi:TIGR00730 family Rossman fold protein [Limnohabitans sp. 2KL-27]|uniref:LOG family protein n=1 Tax=Limnohabitans sp. 2KL-27 TaxID=1100705 RepID=UPI000B7D0D4A|nr:TIGR00730 family Rossman fold protein [Limnohabitans sp. 2KL-27]
MQSRQDLLTPSLPHAWADLQAEPNTADWLEPEAHRLAFADPEFLLRRETRGIRFQLEMLKPDLAQTEAKIEHTVVVFGSARFMDMASAQARLKAALKSGQSQDIALAETAVRNTQHYENARVFAQLVGRSCSCLPDEEKLFICTGGGPGIMEAANRGAQEAGAPSVALNIALPHEQKPNPYVTPELSFKFHYFALRKMHFMMRAKALVAFPGGFGTLDELFEVMTLVQTRKSRAVPILLFGTEFWKRLINMDMLVQEGTVSREDLKLFRYVDTPEDAWKTICEFYQLKVA